MGGGWVQIILWGFRRPGGGFLSERSERNQRIAGGRLSLDAPRPNSPDPRTPVYGGRPLLALWPRPARVISGRLLLLTRCRSPQSPGRMLLPVYSAPGYCSIHPFCRARRPGAPGRGGLWPPAEQAPRVKGGWPEGPGGFRRLRVENVPPPLGGGFLSERSERNQRIAGGRLSLDALRPNSPYPRTPVYGGRALLPLWSWPARVAS